MFYIFYIRFTFLEQLASNLETAQESYVFIKLQADDY